jgi:hypothetical protein
LFYFRTAALEFVLDASHQPCSEKEMDLGLAKAIKALQLSVAPHLIAAALVFMPIRL